MTKYLIVHDMSKKLNADNCVLMGIPKGTTFEVFRDILKSMPKRRDGYDRIKNSNDIWVLPFEVDSDLIFNPKPNVYEVLTGDELSSYVFDEIEDV